MAIHRSRVWLVALAVVLAGTPSVRLATGFAAQRSGQPFDVVIANGRVMDPESSLDSVRNVGISGRTIRAISTDRLEGRITIDAAGLATP